MERLSESPGLACREQHLIVCLGGEQMVCGFVSSFVSSDIKVL